MSHDRNAINLNLIKEKEIIMTEADILQAINEGARCAIENRELLIDYFLNSEVIRGILENPADFIDPLDSKETAMEKVKEMLPDIWAQKPPTAELEFDVTFPEPIIETELISTPSELPDPPEWPEPLELPDPLEITES